MLVWGPIKFLAVSRLPVNGQRCHSYEQARLLTIASRIEERKQPCEEGMPDRLLLIYYVTSNNLAIYMPSRQLIQHVPVFALISDS